MSRAFEETKHFPMDHSLQGEQRRVLRQGEGVAARIHQGHSL